jgi:hypothetical protein
VSPDERVNAVATFGFTERQARFLTTVMLFGGVCVPKQYARFAGTAYGHVVSGFFDKLIERRFATKCPCVHNRAALYHVHHRRLYEAIGEGRSRYRRAVPVGLAVDRVTWLDAVLGHPDVRWLANETEKAELISGAAPTLTPERLPHVTVGQRVRMFPDEALMGVTPTGGAMLLHLVLSSREDEFRAVLQRHGDLLAALPSWTLRLVFTPRTDHVKERFEAAFRDELARPLRSSTLVELRWYFEKIRPADGHLLMRHDDRFRRTQQAFAAPRFRALYSRWLKDGDRALEVVSTDRIAEQLANGTGRLECEVLRLSYGHLSPVVSPRQPLAEAVQKDSQQAETQAARPSCVEPELSISEQLARDWYRLVEAHKERKRLGLTP